MGHHLRPEDREGGREQGGGVAEVARPGEGHRPQQPDPHSGTLEHPADRLRGVPPSFPCQDVCENASGGLAPLRVRSVSDVEAPPFKVLPSSKKVFLFLCKSHFIRPVYLTSALLAKSVILLFLCVFYLHNLFACCFSHALFF